MGDENTSKPAEAEDKTKATANVLIEVTKALPNASPPVRPYLLTVVVAALLIFIMPSLPREFSARDRILVLFSVVCAAAVVQLFGHFYEVISYRFAILQQAPDERRHTLQAAARFPERVTAPKHRSDPQ